MLEASWAWSSVIGSQGAPAGAHVHQLTRSGIQHRVFAAASVSFVSCDSTRQVLLEQLYVWLVGVHLLTGS